MVVALRYHRRNVRSHLQNSLVALLVRGHEPCVAIRKVCRFEERESLGFTSICDVSLEAK